MSKFFISALFIFLASCSENKNPEVSSLELVTGSFSDTTHGNIIYFYLLDKGVVESPFVFYAEDGFGPDQFPKLSFKDGSQYIKLPNGNVYLKNDDSIFLNNADDFYISDSFKFRNKKDIYTYLTNYFKNWKAGESVSR